MNIPACRQAGDISPCSVIEILKVYIPIGIPADYGAGFVDHIGLFTGRMGAAKKGLNKGLGSKE